MGAPPLSDEALKQGIANFEQKQPYRFGDFKSRSWGHSLHSLCSYQGKMKPAQAHWIIQSFTQQGDVVIDPLAGVGTIPFEAALQGRNAVGNDLSPLAATVTKAKINPPTRAEAMEALEMLHALMGSVELTVEDERAADFGLNAKVRDYYHPDTLQELLRARRVFVEGSLTHRGADFVWASLLHVLHGNRPYALSRTSHPITPFSPRGEFEYRGVIERTAKRITRALSVELPTTFVSGTGILGDFRDIPAVVEQTEFADAVVTSPPFLGMRFDRPNWLRLWFCGWVATDFHQTSNHFLERQQTKSLTIYADFYEMCHRALKETGTIIIHVGSGASDRLITALRDLAAPHFRVVGEAVEDVATLQNHGLSDKGKLTTNQHLLFLRRT